MKVHGRRADHESEAGPHFPRPKIQTWEAARQQQQRLSQIDDDECHQTRDGFATSRVANYREADSVSRVLDFLTPPAVACRPHANGGFVICFTNTLKLTVPGCNVDQYPVRANNGLC
jgi:hypothetical protein